MYKLNILQRNIYFKNASFGFKEEQKRLNKLNNYKNRVQSTGIK